MATPTRNVEKTYKKVNQLDHVLLRPDSYVGSIESVTQAMWVWNDEAQQMENREITFVPALYKIFDEILVNAADNKSRDKNMRLIKINIQKEDNQISVFNDGKGIPIEMHKVEKMYVPELIFGNLLTSSNYDDEEKKVTGGRNGYGAKLCNIFSTKFTVETADRKQKKKYSLSWTNNMKNKGETKISPYDKDDYTKITFRPDFARFKMTHLTDDVVALFQKRAYDIAGTTAGITVFLNGQKIKMNPKSPFKSYCELYVQNKFLDTGNPVKLEYEALSNKEAKGRWEVGFAVSNDGFQNVSFVNSIATVKGGRHVDVVVDQLVKEMEKKVNAKNKGGLKVKAHQIKSHCWIFVNSQIENPSFDSQTKDMMTLVKSKHGSSPQLSDAFVKQIMKSGVIESISNFMRFKEQQGKTKMGGAKSKNVRIEKYEGATKAGTKESKSCTLILTEGDSAKTLAIAGISSINKGKEYYGCFPLRGKLLNVREAGHAQIMKNKEVDSMLKIMGLKSGKKADLAGLRYGKVMIMTDQDVDGSHIKGLIVNLFHNWWPELLKNGVIDEFITPIVKVTKGDRKLSFYSLPEFNKWMNNTPGAERWKVKYYKGLGTSDNKEAREYFGDLRRHRIPFRYSGANCDDKIEMAFKRERVADRKEWLTGYMTDLAQRREEGEDEITLYDRENIPYVTFNDFIDKELVLFSYEDLERAVPNCIDGFKPGQRKIIWVCFKRNDKREVKVAQLCGSVAEKSAYHHGEVSLQTTIIKQAQNYVGSNNVNLLMPNGQFGSRLKGGKDHAAPRYIFTMLSPLTRYLYPEVDEVLFDHKTDDNMVVEPEFFAPIIPMVLVNGSAGIGTGWSTNIPNHDVREVTKNVRLMLDGREPLELVPSYKNFRGKVEMIEPNKCIMFGEISILDDDTVEITELPPTVWTEDYKEKLELWLLDKDEKGKPKEQRIKDLKNLSSNTRVKFVVTLTPSQMREASKKGFHNYFDLVKTRSYSNTMTLFDEYGKLQEYKSAVAICKNHFKVRREYYVKRHAYLLSKKQAEMKRISNKARFILEKIEGTISVMNKKKKDVVQMLKERGYDSDPVKAWAQKLKREKGIEVDERIQGDGEDADDDEPQEGLDYDYLLTMPILNLTKEKKDKLLKEKDDLQQEYNILKKKTPDGLWVEDLDAFEEKLAEHEAKEREDMMPTKGKKSKGKPNMEVEPSAYGERQEPVLTDELRAKHITKPVREKKPPKVKKEAKGAIIKATKCESNPSVKSEMASDDDSVKDTVKDRKKGKGKNPWDTDSEDSAGDDLDDDAFDDDDDEPKPKPSSRTTKRARELSSDTAKPDKKKQSRQGTIMDSFKKVAEKKIKSESGSDEESPAKKTKAAVEDSDSDEPVQKEKQKKKNVWSSDDESEDDDFVPKKGGKVQESSSDVEFGSESEPEKPIKKAEPKKVTKKTAEPKKVIKKTAEPKKTVKKQPTKAPAKKSVKKPKAISSDDDEEVAPKKVVAKKKAVSDDEDFNGSDSGSEIISLAARVPRRGAGTTQKKKYTFSSDSDSD